MELRISDLVVARGGVPVLDRVSVVVPAGGAVILRGPNGAGKTTLLRTLAGLQPPLAGQVDPGPDSVAYAGHADGLKATLSVRENLAFWAAVHGTGGVDAALAAFALAALHDRPALNLSAGQRRRLGLARLLVAGRPIWALDEPTVSLDAASAAQFVAVVQRHLAGGGAAVIATHVDLGLAAPVLDLTAFRLARRSLGAFDEALG